VHHAAHLLALHHIPPGTFSVAAAAAASASFVAATFANCTGIDGAAAPAVESTDDPAQDPSSKQKKHWSNVEPGQNPVVRVRVQTAAPQSQLKWRST
jgi:hypothetical protein